jgi:hypothetical protein
MEVETGVDLEGDRFPKEQQYYYTRYLSSLLRITAYEGG